MTLEWCLLAEEAVSGTAACAPGGVVGLELDGPPVVAAHGQRPHEALHEPGPARRGERLLAVAQEVGPRPEAAHGEAQHRVRHAPLHHRLCIAVVMMVVVMVAAVRRTAVQAGVHERDAIHDEGVGALVCRLLVRRKHLEQLERRRLVPRPHQAMTLGAHLLQPPQRPEEHLCVRGRDRHRWCPRLRATRARRHRRARRRSRCRRAGGRYLVVQGRAPEGLDFGLGEGMLGEEGGDLVGLPLELGLTARQVRGPVRERRHGTLRLVQPHRHRRARCLQRPNNALDLGHALLQGRERRDELLGQQHVLVLELLPQAPARLERVGAPE